VRSFGHIEVHIQAVFALVSQYRHQPLEVGLPLSRQAVVRYRWPLRADRRHGVGELDAAPGCRGHRRHIAQRADWRRRVRHAVISLDGRRRSGFNAAQLAVSRLDRSGAVFLSTSQRLGTRQTALSAEKRQQEDALGDTATGGWDSLKSPFTRDILRTSSSPLSFISFVVVPLVTFVILPISPFITSFTGNPACLAIPQLSRNLTTRRENILFPVKNIVPRSIRYDNRVQMNQEYKS